MSDQNGSNYLETILSIIGAFTVGAALLIPGFWYGLYHVIMAIAAIAAVGGVIFCVGVLLFKGFAAIFRRRSSNG